MRPNHRFLTLLPIMLFSRLDYPIEKFKSEKVLPPRPAPKNTEVFYTSRDQKRKLKN